MELNQIQFKYFCNFEHGNMLHLNHTSEAYHTHFQKVQNDQTMSHVTWLSLNSNWSLNLQFKLQYTPFKWNCLNTSKHIHQVSTFNHVLVHCIYFAILFVVCRVEVEPEQEAAPFVEDPEPEPRQQGKQTPIDHVDKIPLPSHVSLMHCRG